MRPIYLLGADEIEEAELPEVERPGQGPQAGAARSKRTCRRSTVLGAAAQGRGADRSSATNRKSAATTTALAAAARSTRSAAAPKAAQPNKPHYFPNAKRGQTTIKRNVPFYGGLTPFLCAEITGRAGPCRRLRGFSGRRSCGGRLLLPLRRPGGFRWLPAALAVRRVAVVRVLSWLCLLMVPPVVCKPLPYGGPGTLTVRQATLPLKNTRARPCRAS